MKTNDIVSKLKAYKFRDALNHPLENCLDFKRLVEEAERVESERHKYHMALTEIASFTRDGKRHLPVVCEMAEIAQEALGNKENEN